MKQVGLIILAAASVNVFIIGIGEVSSLNTLGYPKEVVIRWIITHPSELQCGNVKVEGEKRGALRDGQVGLEVMVNLVRNPGDWLFS